MTNIASHINEMKKRHEHSIRVQELQTLLYGQEVGIRYILMVSTAKNRERLCVRAEIGLLAPLS